jgi:mannose-6-phosphate isomerase-like protein (cupin superfamily)
MVASVIDLINYPPLPPSHGKKVFHDAAGFHVWMHADRPGEKGPMHTHTAAEIFYCVQGTCTFHFREQASQAMKPGMLIIIPKGHFYQLENNGSDYLILLGTRAEAAQLPRFDPQRSIVREGGSIPVGVDAPGTANE